MVTGGEAPKAHRRIDAGNRATAGASDPPVNPSVRASNALPEDSTRSDRAERAGFAGSCLREIPARKWSAPAGMAPRRGCRLGPRNSARGSCKPNSVVCGHSSRRRVAADAHQRPTRRLRHCMRQPLKAPPNARNRLNASGRCAAPPGSWRTHPSLFGLAPCGVYPASDVTAGAVRSYRTFSPLPRRWSFRNGEPSRQAGPTRVLRFQGGPPAGSEETREG